MNKSISLLLSLFLGSQLIAQDQPAVRTLEDCVDYALTHAPSLARRQISHTNQVLSVQQARAKFTPTLNLSDTYDDPSGDNTVDGSISQTLPGDLDVRLSASHSDEVVDYALRLSKVLLGGGSILESKLSITKGELDEAANWNRYSLERRSLRFSVTRAYYSVVNNLLTLKLRELQLERAKRNLEVAEVRQEPLDIATARLRIPESELDLLRTQRSITSSLLELRELIGMPLDQPLEVGTDIEYEPVVLTFEEDLSFAVEDREDIRNARIALRKSELDYRVAKTKNGPTVSGSLNVSDGDSTDETESRGEISLSIPWGDRVDRLATARAENQVRDQELALFQATQARSRSVRSLALRVHEAEKSVELQEESLKVLEQQLDLYQDRWDNGEIDILEFIRSQNNLENARVRLVSQKMEYLELLAEYRFNVGR